MYHLISDRVMRKRIKIALPFLQGNVLDIGCGNGSLRSCLNGQCKTYRGVDIIAKDSELFYNIDIEKIEQRVRLNGKFNSIVMLAVIEHLKQPFEVICWCNRKLENEGRIIITTPTKLGNQILEKVFHLESGHLYIFDETRLREMLVNSRFVVEQYSKFELGANQIIIGRKVQ